MIETSALSASALGLIFLLGLRHGLDPDHIAVIDNLTFQAAEDRPRLAPWIGTLFAIGHSLSVAVVALGVAFLATELVWPSWAASAVDIAIISLLILVGTLNLRALLRTQEYRPIGWRTRLVPRALRSSSHPLAVIGVGAIFGLVFDTATQAAAWGSVAVTGGGVTGALLIAFCFAAGMILTDTIDSQIVARLLRTRGDQARVRRYRRGVGWVIVGLSYGMACYALVTGLWPDIEIGDFAFTLLGLASAALVIAMLVYGRRKPAANIAKI